MTDHSFNIPSGGFFFGMTASSRSIGDYNPYRVGANYTCVSFLQLSLFIARGNQTQYSEVKNPRRIYM